MADMKNSFDLSKSVTYPLRGIAMIMIIMHHAYLSFQSLGYVSIPLWLGRSGIDYAWGYCGTGIFFFMSGYGMFFSLTKHRINCAYIKDKCLKLLSPYIALWVISLIAFAIFSRQTLSTDLLRHFFILDIPPDVNGWFFKIIVAFYALSMLTFHLVKNLKWCIVIIGTCTMLWYLFACFELRLGPWWFVSVLNFPLGMVFAINKNKIQNVSPLLVAVGSGVLVVGVIWLHPHPTIISLLVSIFAVAFAQLIRLRGRILSFIGTESIYFYLLEVPVMFLLDLYCKMNFFVYVIVCLLIVSALTIVSKYTIYWVRQTMPTQKDKD